MTCARRKAVAAAGLFLVPLSQLVPNHYAPWATFHQDAFAIVAFGIAVCGSLYRDSPQVVWPASAVLIFACTSIPMLQFAFGIIYFLGDAIVPSFYLALFAIAIVVGNSLDATDKDRKASVVPLLLGLLSAGILSVGIALYQWLSLSGLAEWAADLPPGGRPFANVAQPNLLATFLIAGLAATYYLFNEKHIGVLATLMASLFLVFGAALTGSRAAWVETLIFLSWMLIRRHSFQMRFGAGLIISTGVALFLCVVSIVPLSNSLGVAAGRTMDEQISGGRTRLDHWAALVDAAGKEPLLGYGWNQVAVAQARVAGEHPFTGELLDHSHNTAIDLVIWNGVPLGFLLLFVVLGWLAHQFYRPRDAPSVILLGLLSVVLIHALVEFPLEFAGFLLPFGVVIGALEQRSKRSRIVRLPFAFHCLILSGCTLIGTWIAVEYLEVESSTRILRLETARIGPTRANSAPPDIVLLTQQRELLRFARTEAHREMDASTLEWMRRIAGRFGYPQVLLRYALAAGLNGQSREASATLNRLCKIHSYQRCEEGREAWIAMSNGPFPELSAISFPSGPGADSQ